MIFKYFIVLTIFINTLISNDKIENSIGFINVNSNVSETKIYLNNQYIGDAPIERYQVDANSNLELKAISNKKFYPKDFIRNINVKKLKIQSYTAEFKKANAKLLLIGKDGYLYINDRFERTLNSNNRVITIPASEKIKIEIRNGDDKYTTLKDMYANEFYKLEYNLDNNSVKDKKLQDELALKGVKNIDNELDGKSSKEKKSSIVTIDSLIWQDTQDITKKRLLYKKGEDYCKNLDLEGYKDWSLPTIEQLKGLYKNKEKFYNKFKDNYYWSSTKVKGDYVYWDYISTMNFENNIVTTINGSSNEANQICVRIIKPE
ncbi:MAG: DUF1566 domain-containing protein [Campylobacterota bacterium]|nr:DUF1566 domain-containing protein [Campylobacterota bacterium]